MKKKYVKNIPIDMWIQYITEVWILNKHKSYFNIINFMKKELCQKYKLTTYRYLDTMYNWGMNFKIWVYIGGKNTCLWKNLGYFSRQIG